VTVVGAEPSRTVCAPPKPAPAPLKDDCTASVRRPLLRRCTPRQTTTASPRAFAAVSTPASMKCALVPSCRGAPQLPREERIAARIVSGPIVGIGRDSAAPLCAQATTTSPAPVTATLGRVAVKRPPETRRGELQPWPARRTATWTPRASA